MPMNRSKTLMVMSVQLLERIACDQPLDLERGPNWSSLVGRQCRRDEVCHGAEVVVGEAACGQRRIADSQARGDHRGRVGRVPRCG